ncbi:hypothetical protein F5Y18DRAFT_424591 [Xylariaceae sp. FL1019]|nr:hypothetical protein F5Y18DRAFT_424591 [Xylariaceae sp. FL1019]
MRGKGTLIYTSLELLILDLECTVDGDQVWWGQLLSSDRLDGLRLTSRPYPSVPSLRLELTQALSIITVYSLGSLLDIDRLCSVREPVADDLAKSDVSQSDLGHTVINVFVLRAPVRFGLAPDSQAAKLPDYHEHQNPNRDLYLFFAACMREPFTRLAVSPIRRIQTENGLHTSFIQVQASRSPTIPPLTTDRYPLSTTTTCQRDTKDAGQLGITASLERD